MKPEPGRLAAPQLRKIIRQEGCQTLEKAVQAATGASGPVFWPWLCVLARWLGKSPPWVALNVDTGEYLPFVGQGNQRLPNGRYAWTQELIDLNREYWEAK